MRNWRKALDRSLHWVDHDHDHEGDHHKHNKHNKTIHKIAIHSAKTSSSLKNDKNSHGDGEGVGGNDSGGGFVSDSVVAGVVAGVAGRARSSSGSTPLGTTGIPSTSAIVNDALSSGSGKGSSPGVGAVRTLTTTAALPASSATSAASAVAALPHTPSASTSTVGALEMPLRSLRYTHTQKFAMCVVVGAAVGFGFAAGAEAFSALKNRK